ncbi:MAG: cache domain-containing protein [Magnetococcus sp. YQC-5]
MFNHVRIGTRLLVLFFIVGILPLGVLGWHAKTVAEAALLAKAFAQLESIRQIKKSRIEHFFERNSRDLQTSANIITLLQDDAHDRLEILKTHVQRDIEGYFQELTHTVRMMKENAHLRETVQELNKAYLTAEKKIKTLAWNDLINQYNPHIRQLIHDKGLEDILLITQDGEILYTLERQADLGQNLTLGKWRETNLGQAWHQIQTSQDDESVIFADFAPWEPVGGMQMGFAVSRIKEKGETLGYLALRFTPKTINDLVAQSLIKPKKEYLKERLNANEETLDLFLVGRNAENFSLRSNQLLKKNHWGSLLQPMAGQGVGRGRADPYDLECGRTHGIRFLRPLAYSGIALGCHGDPAGRGVHGSIAQRGTCGDSASVHKKLFLS